MTDYTFNNLCRISEDSGTNDLRSIQNTEACNYLLQNYFAQDCAMNSAKSFAVSQPCINYTGSHGMGVGGCNVDDSSNILIGSIQTKPKTRIDLFGRPFVTVPYLGRGSVDPTVESQLRQGESITNKRTVTRLTEKSYIHRQTVPLIPEVKSNIQNPNRMIESDAKSDWVRGGLPSRELARDVR